MLQKFHVKLSIHSLPKAEIQRTINLILSLKVDSKGDTNMANAVMAIQVLPKADSTKEMLRLVDVAIAEIDASGLSYEVSAFETTVEGDLDDLIKLLHKIQISVTESGAASISNYIKLSYAPEAHILTTDEKLAKYRAHNEAQQG